MNVSTQPDFVERPRDQLLSYPSEMRWELTRRNPFYLALWKLVSDFHKNPSLDEESLIFGMAAKVAIGKIGVTGVPIPPETESSAIGSSDPAFLCGAIQPMTLRNTAAILLHIRNVNGLRFLSNAFKRCAEILENTKIDEAQRSQSHLQLLHSLRLAPIEELECIPDAPFFYLHSGASLETIKEDTIRQAKFWKAKRSQDSPKIHTAKITKYLKVWDAVEGWSEGKYYFDKELTFRQVADTHKLSVSTIYDQYKQAFYHIVGSDFTVPLWQETIGRFKVNSYFIEPSRILNRFLRRIAQTIHQIKQVTETTLDQRTASEKSGSFLNTIGHMDNNAETYDLADELMRLISEGQSDDRILESMGWMHDTRMRLLVQNVRMKNLDLSKLVRANSEVVE